MESTIPLGSINVEIQVLFMLLDVVLPHYLVSRLVSVFKMADSISLDFNLYLLNL